MVQYTGEIKDELYLILLRTESLFSFKLVGDGKIDKGFD